MLKFADLSVDFKSYENSLNSYMKLFPGSYTPLLIMYLAHKGLLKLVSEFEENDPRILVKVDGNSLHDFFGVGIMKNLIEDPDVWEQDNMTFEETVELMNKAILKDRDVYVMLPFVHLWPYILAGKSIALIADVAKDDQIKDLIDCITFSDRASNNPAALMYFSVMLMKKYEPIYDEVQDLESPDEREDEDKLAQEIWVEDFENTLGAIMSYSGDNYWIQPEELTRIILTQYNGGPIYNPFAGLASYAIQLHYEVELGEKEFWPSNIPSCLGDIYYFGEEIMNVAWAIGKLRLLAHESDSKNYIIGDSTKWRKGTINNILSTPPFVIIENEVGKKEYADHFVIRHGIDTIEEGGLLACVVPMSFMSRKDTADIRKRIVEEGILESIIYLPENIFSNTSTRTAILFVRKKEHHRVKLINATSCIHHKSGKVNILDEETIAKILCFPNHPIYSEFVSNDENEDELPDESLEKLKVYASYNAIAKAHYDLTPGRYFSNKIPNIEGFELIRISEIVESTPDNIGKTGKGKVIRPALLSKDSFTSLLPDNIPEEVYHRQYKMVNQDALLFSPLSSLRPTLLVNPNKVCVYLKSDTVQAVYLRRDTIDPEYLVIELNKPYVQEQLRLLAKGDVISRLSLEDFLSIQVYVPNSRSKALVLEKETVEQQKSVYYSKINAELSTLKDHQHDKYVKMLRQRKHRIGQILGDLVPGFDSLDDLRIENGGILRNSDVVAPKTGETVEDYFVKLRKIIERVDKLVRNLTDNEVWGKASPLSILDFLNDIPNNHLAENFRFQFDIRHNTQSLDNDIIRDYYILVNESDLSTVFENIISNASKYGFIDSERKDYLIRIAVDDDMIDNLPAVRICISNNGSPIHPSVDRNRFFDWGYGSGDGIGTWQLKETVEHYGGIVRLKEYPDEIAGFCTEYEIILPLINDM